MLWFTVLILTYYIILYCCYWFVYYSIDWKVCADICAAKFPEINESPQQQQ